MLTRRAPLKRSPLRRQSPKHRRAQLAWSLVVKQAIADVGGVCQIHAPGCTSQATEGHHLVARSQGGKHTRDNCVPCCHSCGQWVHQYPNDAEARGFVVKGWAA